MIGFDWANAQSVEDAAAAGCGTTADAMQTHSGEAASGAILLKAGGIDLLDLMKAGLLAPRRVVSLRLVPDLRGIAEGMGGSVRIGAMATLAQVASNPMIVARYPALSEAAGHSASPQIRRMATLGGNLLQRPRCWYFRSRHHHCVRKGGEACFAFSGENQYHAVFGQSGCAMVHPSTPATALVALGASLEIDAAGGHRRTVPLKTFLLTPDQDIGRENDLAPGEVVTTIVLPPLPDGARSLHVRQGELDSFDWPLADVAVMLDMGAGGACRTASVVLGSVAPTPYRARAAEQVLAGRIIDAAGASEAARAALAGATPLTRNAFKLPVIEALVRRTILAAIKGGGT